MNIMNEKKLEQAVSGAMAPKTNEVIQMQGRKVGVFYGEK